MNANPESSIERQREIFLKALEKASPAERAAYLDGACGEDRALRAQVEALLQHHTTDSFLERPALAAEQTQLVEGVVSERAGTVIDRYKLLQQIGEGGMGVVYMAEQEEPVRRRVALKIIKLGMDTKQVVARFEAERQALAMMDHPNIARVLDGGATETGRPYFVMELVQGVPITEFCDKNKLSAKDRLKLFIQVCQAIQSAHQKGIIHRDIKPSNVLVTLHHGDPMPKVIDFGVAKATNQKLTEKTLFTNYATMIGTPAYMSPEQAEMSSMDIDTRTDVYALGVLLYELLTGTTPFPEKRLRSLGYGEMQRVIVEEEPERPSTRLSTMANEQKTAVAKNRGEELAALSKLLKGDLDWVVMKCLEKDRTRRYDTANGVAADIQRHLNNEPVVARPPSPAYRLQKAFRRNKIAFTCTIAVGLTLLAGIIASTWEAAQATRAKNIARENEQKAERAQTTAQAEAKRADQKAAEAEQEKSAASQNAYVAKMLLAQADWENDNLGHLRQVLAETRDYPDRGFEWFYWQQQCHLDARTLRGHLAPIMGIAFSPDGQRLVTASDDSTAKIWNTSTGRELFTLAGHKGFVRSLAFFPDGERVITGSLDYTAKIWNVNTGRELLTLTNHKAGIVFIRFSPDGRRVATGSDDCTAKLWDTSVWRELASFEGHKGTVRFVALTSDGQRLVTASDTDRTARVWDASTGRELRRFEGYAQPGVSPDGQRILTWSEDSTAKMWDASTGRELFARKLHSAEIKSVAFSPDGQRIVTVGADGVAKIWDANNGSELLNFTERTGAVASLGFSPDGQQIVGWNNRGLYEVWDAKTGRESFLLKGHTGWALRVAFSADGQRIASGGEDHVAKIWESGTQRGLLTFRAHNQAICCIVFSPDGQRLATASDDRRAKVCDARTGHEVLSLIGHNGEIMSIAFAPDSQRMLTASKDDTARVWDSSTGRELLKLAGHRGWVQSATFSSDGQKIVSGSWDKTAKVWDGITGTEMLTLTGHVHGVTSVAFSSDNVRIVTGGWDRMAKVWDTGTGRELLTLRGHTEGITSVAFSRDGQRIVTCSSDKTAKIWDASGGRELLTLRGHTGSIRSAGFSPDGRRVVTGSEDQTTKIWDASSGRELLTLKGSASPIYSVAFSPDGLRIATGSGDGTATVCSRSSEQQTAAWLEEERAGEQHVADLNAQRVEAAERERKLRADDQGAIKQWLILAPIPLPKDERGARGLDRNQIPDEANLRPQAGDKVSVGDREFIWDKAELDDYIIDFKMLLGAATSYNQFYENCAAYAVCYIVAEKEVSDVTMKIGSDDDAKIYLNGIQRYECRYSRGIVPDVNAVSGIRLNAGSNVLIFKFVNESYDWGGSLRLTDKDGNPVKGIKVTLSP